MASLKDLTPVTLVYDTALGSPPNDVDLQALGGKEVMIEPKFVPLPAQGMFYGQPGYSRQTGGLWQWILTGGDPSSQIDVFVDGLTGQSHGWSDQTARGVWKQSVQRLRAEGLPRNLIQTMTTQQFNAAKTEVIAEQRTPG